MNDLRPEVDARALVPDVPTAEGGDAWAPARRVAEVTVFEVWWGEPSGQGWLQIGELAVAWILSALIGFERELKQKAAGVRTYTVVGFGAALFMLVSKYGFTDVLMPGKIILDPSRVAAQIVSGLGFIGGGIIFVKRDSVRGLTTAASIWLTAAVGSAAGAGLPILAIMSTAVYFVTVLGLRPAAAALGRRFGVAMPTIRVQYLDGHGILRDILREMTDSGFLVADVSTSHHRRPNLRRWRHSDEDDQESAEPPSVELRVQLNGRGNLGSLITAVANINGVLAVTALNDEDEAI